MSHAYCNSGAPTIYVEIGTSFGPLHGKIWRIGTMGYVCRKANVLRCVGALEALLRRAGMDVPAGAGIDAAYAEYDGATTAAFPEE